jgi:hypothetical protein
MNSILGKILGWGQFALAGVSSIQQAAPHTVTSWLTLAGSLLTAVALHGASSTDGVK